MVNSHDHETRSGDARRRAPRQGHRPAPELPVSRRAARARTPTQPSYFLKPSDLGRAERDDPSSDRRAPNCSASRARSPSSSAARHGESRQSDAWAHVSGVTAANDLGVYDLRWADKGSQPALEGRRRLHPDRPRELIAAAGLDPAALRIRTWVNGELVQDDTTADLLFPFARLVADLSQLITLEPGDVILTGTPGRRVGRPTRRPVEVEVDAPTRTRAPDDRTAGHRRRRRAPRRSPTSGAKPHADDLQRIEAWGSREKAGLDARVRARPTDLRRPARLRRHRHPQLAVAQARATTSVSIDGVRPTHPGQRLRRPRAHAAVRPVPPRPVRRARRRVQRAEARVRLARARRRARHRGPRRGGTGTVGDILALRAQVRGAVGIVTDGGVRDFAAVAALDIPTFCAGPHPAVLGRRHVPWEIDVTIACGGATVQPGDVIVGDDDGVLVIPPALVPRWSPTRDRAGARRDVHRRAGGRGRLRRRLYPMNADVEGAVRDMAWSTGRDRSTTPKPSSKSRRPTPASRRASPTAAIRSGYRLVLGPDRRTSSTSASCRCARRSAGSRPRGSSPSSATSARRSRWSTKREYVFTMQTLSIVEGAATALSAPFMTAADLARARAINEQMTDVARPLRPAPLHRAQPRVPRGAVRALPEPAHPRPGAPRLGRGCAVLRDSTFSFVPGRASDSVDEHERAART